ncbi:RnfABCDGE type electron transport complex subunit B [Dokdonella sp.]|uniref:RnfABCDGE type electron transport complex subunit B n=1 Tax=Dokdonella sp. TaxID=2291710 RepID=UPI003C5B9F6D
MNTDVVMRINALLPQTQCTRCGYPACLPYAQAIANGSADIDQCPPGGQAGVDALAVSLGRLSKPLNPDFGLEAPPSFAVIDEDVCISCTKCIQACPVDAIVGAAKRMHTIIEAECTGCELCIPPCPVDCIAMIQSAGRPLTRPVVEERAKLARRRFEEREVRHSRKDKERGARRELARKKVEPISRNAVLEAIARGKAKRAATNDPSNDPGST